MPPHCRDGPCVSWSGCTTGASVARTKRTRSTPGNRCAPGALQRCCVGRVLCLARCAHMPCWQQLPLLLQSQLCILPTVVHDRQLAAMQAPLTWVDKASLAMVRALQTVIILALAWHVYAWLSSSISLLIWRYSLSWPNWLTLK